MTSLAVTRAARGRDHPQVMLYGAKIVVFVWSALPRVKGFEGWDPLEFVQQPVRVMLVRALRPGRVPPRPQWIRVFCRNAIDANAHGG